MPTTPLAPPDVAESLKQDWRGGSAPDLRAALRDHPTLLRHRSLVLDLAYEAYALREAAGSAPDPESFCRELPAFRSDVRGMLLDYRALMAHPELLAGPEPVHYPEPGESFEGFTVVRQLGHGAFARAYLATDPDTGGRRVVLKLSPTASGESRAQGQVRHPHVAEVLWARRVAGMSALCMPYGGAATLRDVVAATFEVATGPPTARTVLDAIDAAGVGLPSANDPVPPALLAAGGSYADAIARIAAQLAGAVAYLHARGVTHGDLKPSNIVLAPGGHPYLIDFNLSGRDGDGNRYGGTLPYLAPERVRRLTDKQAGVGDGPPADVYSFGAVLYEALTGRVPFEPVPAGDLKEMATAHLQRQMIGAPRLVAAGVSRGLARLVDQCLSVTPADRPTAADLERRLRRFGRRRVRRNGVALAAVAAVLVGAVALEAARPPTADELIARGMRSLDRGDRAAAAVQLGDAFRLRPDGRSAAYLGYLLTRSADHKSAVALYRQSIDAGYREAWVYNNLAHGLSQPGSGAEAEWIEAIQYADLADRLDPRLHEARFNRLRARYHLELDKGTRRLRDPQPVVADVRAALADGPVPAIVYLLAARALSAAHADHHADAVEYLRAAVKRGRDPGTLKDDPILARHLSGRPDFQEVVGLPPGAAPVDSADPFLATPPR